MGCFDSVMVPCPRCGERSEFQSKSGECLLKTYDLEHCPPNVLADVNRHGPHECRRCGATYQVDVQFIAAPKLVMR
jgi:ribosomal protein L37E